MTIGKKILIINKFYQGDITLPKKDSALETLYLSREFGYYPSQIIKNTYRQLT